MKYAIKWNNITEKYVLIVEFKSDQ